MIKVRIFCTLWLAAGFAFAGESGKLLFLDLWKLDYWRNIELNQGRPEWIRECEYRDPSFPTGGVNFPSVWRDSKSGKWRLIHSIKWSPFTMMIAESDDGISWRPQVVPGIDQIAPNHLLTVPSASGGAIYHDPDRTDGYAMRIFGRQRGAPVKERALADPDHILHEAAKSDSADRLSRRRYYLGFQRRFEVGNQNRRQMELAGRGLVSRTTCVLFSQ